MILKLDSDDYVLTRRSIQHTWQAKLTVPDSVTEAFIARQKKNGWQLITQKIINRKIYLTFELELHWSDDDDEESPTFFTAG